MYARAIGLLATMGVIAGAALVWLLSQGDELQRDLAGVGAHIAVPEPATALVVTAPGGVLASGLYGIGEDRLRVRVTSGLEAARGAELAREERSLILGLFGDHQVPYPGALSTTLRCPEHLLPAALEPGGSAAFVLGLYANDRLSYGGCAEDLLRYRATVAAFVDPNGGRLVRVEYFEPMGSSAPPRGPEVVRSFGWE